MSPKTTINQERLARLATLSLVSGNGAAEQGDACVMNVVDWLAGGDGTSDSPECVDPVIARFAIGLNDAEVFGAYRDELKAYVVRMVDTRGSAALARQRAHLLADWAVRTIAPMALDEEWAARLRALPPVVDALSARKARNVAYAVCAAPYYVFDHTAAASAADVAAYAAYASAGAAAAAAYTSAADTAANVAVAAARVVDKRLVWDAALRLLGDLIDAREEVGR